MLFDLQNVQKSYGNYQALKGITLQIQEGSVGLLGPNGAGKSTLIKTLLGLIDLSGGSASVLGYRLPEDADKIRQAIGYMPENDCYLPSMTAVSYVTLMGELTGMPRAQALSRAHETLHYVGLGEARYRKLGGFSTGMKQRVKLAQALVHGPKLVFLDEPTNGLDPQGRDEMLDLIGDVKSRGISVVLSSHILYDVEKVCESMIMLNHGELIHFGTIAGLKADRQKAIVEIETKEQNEKFGAILKERGFSVEQQGLRLMVRLVAPQTVQGLLDAAIDEDIQVRRFMPAELTLEKAFLSLLDEHAHRAPAA